MSLQIIRGEFIKMKIVCKLLVKNQFLEGAYIREKIRGWGNFKAGHKIYKHLFANLEFISSNHAKRFFESIKNKSNKSIFVHGTRSPVLIKNYMRLWKIMFWKNSSSRLIIFCTYIITWIFWGRLDFSNTKYLKNQGLLQNSTKTTTPHQNSLAPTKTQGLIQNSEHPPKLRPGIICIIHTPAPIFRPA